jgi:putative redox protein
MTTNFVTFRLYGEGSGVAQTVREVGAQHVIQTDAHPAFGGHDTAPSPLAYALAALTSCTQVTSQIVARDLGLTLGQFHVAVDAKLDPTVLTTGAEGVSNFTRLTLDVSVDTNADPELFARFGREVERRCPVTQLFRRSGVEVNTSWTPNAPRQQKVA